VSTDNEIIMRNIRDVGKNVVTNTGGRKRDQVAALRAELATANSDKTAAIKRSDRLKSVLFELCKHINSSPSWTEDTLDEILQLDSEDGPTEAAEDTALRILQECTK